MNFEELIFLGAMKYKNTVSEKKVKDFLEKKITDARLKKFQGYLKAGNVGMIFEDIDKETEKKKIVS